MKKWDVKYLNVILKYVLKDVEDNDENHILLISHPRGLISELQNTKS
jgi:hypothetical protein